MVHDYKRTTVRGSWPEESMREAVQTVLDGKMGYYKATKQFNVPQKTLERKVKAARKVLNETSDENLPITIEVPLDPRQKEDEKKRKDELQKKTTTKAVNKKSKKNSRSAKTAKRRRVSSSGVDSEEEGDTPCMYCEEVYRVSIEGWISCSLCRRWAHNSCAGIDDDHDEATHVCEFCQLK